MTNQFTQASKSTIALNPHIFAAGTLGDVLLQKPERPQRTQKMTQAEANFALILEAMFNRGDIKRWLFEGLTLRWFDMRYTPDFVITPAVQGRLTLIEVKGAHIWDRDLVRFKGARAFWKDEFDFELHQLNRGEWRRLY